MAGFSFTDDEVQLLLSCVKDLKAQNDSEGKDWESLRNKYELLTGLVTEQYPKDKSEKFPHEKEYQNILKKNVQNV